MVLRKVSPLKDVIRFRNRGTLGPQYIRLFRVTTRVGRVAYGLDLPSDLSQIHNTFHVLQLLKCLLDDEVVFPLDDIQVDKRLNYV